MCVRMHLKNELTPEIFVTYVFTLDVPSVEKAEKPRTTFNDDRTQYLLIPLLKKWEILNINMNNVHIREENKMKVKKRTLLILASIVWLIAGFNIIRIGILSYTGM